MWIASDPRSHVQATGRDARGRKQYRYHPRYREHQEEAKFELLVPFGHALPQLRRQVDRDLRRHGVPRERVIAAMVELLDRTLIRVGNEEYARANGSFGLTTLRNRHVQVEGSHLRMHFAGKSNKQFDVSFDDPRLARIVTRCQDLPGQLLFQYVNGDGTPRPVRSSDVNDYFREHSGLEATAKTFRTWNATVYAAAALAAAPPPESAREGRSTVMAMLKVVSAELNNTPAVCRRSYIHPAVIDTYLDGSSVSAGRQRRHADLVSSPPRSARLCRCSNAATAAEEEPWARCRGSRDHHDRRRSDPHHRGGVTYYVVHRELKDQDITVSEDAKHNAGKSVEGPFTAYSQAMVIKTHAQEIAGERPTPSCRRTTRIARPCSPRRSCNRRCSRRSWRSGSLRW